MPMPLNDKGEFYQHFGGKLTCADNHCFAMFSRQFDQRFMHASFVQNFGAKNYKAVFWV